MESATHVAWIAVSIEIVWRVYHCPELLLGWPSSFIADDRFEFFYCPLSVFLICYGGCILMIIINIKDNLWFQSQLIRNMISYFHAIDGFLALLIGLGLYFQSIFVVTVGLLGITKAFLLYMLSRMVTGERSYGKYSMILQTTKTYLHHCGSFLFISYPSVALITAIWRFISMNGHAAMTFRKYLSEKTYDVIMWRITHARNLILLFVLAACWIDPTIRRGFGVSAVGHFSYMIVRLGPVFRIGSMYLNSKDEKELWSRISDLERIKLLLSGRYPWFAFELLILSLACIYFLYLRLSIEINIVPFHLSTSKSCLFI